MTFMTGLQCHLCGANFPAEALWVCDQCLGPLEVVYDYAGVREALTREVIERRPRQPLAVPGAAADRRRAAAPASTPATRRWCAPTGSRKRLGMRELYIKDDSVNHPTLSYKDRVVSMAATRAVELGFKVFGCASTGNLANSVAAHAARLGLECYVFIPHDLELGKVLGSAIFRPHVVAIGGNYDDVNRLCTQIADKFGWGFANINLRCLLRRRRQDDRVRDRRAARLALPAASRVARGGRNAAAADSSADSASCAKSAWSKGELPRIHAAQAAGCAPVVHALEAGLEFPEPVKPGDHRQVDRDRQPGRRLPGRQDGEGDRRVRRRVERRGDPAGHAAAGGDRRHLHRAGRRHDARGGRHPDSARASSRRTSRSSSASPATATRPRPRPSRPEWRLESKSADRWKRSRIPPRRGGNRRRAATSVKRTRTNQERRTKNQEPRTKNERTKNEEPRTK